MDAASWFTIVRSMPLLQEEHKNAQCTLVITAACKRCTYEFVYYGNQACFGGSSGQPELCPACGNSSYTKS